MKYTSAILVLSNYFSVFVYFTTEVNAINTNANKNTDKNGCYGLVTYKFSLHTYWTREKFPKHYPDWKPPAQWSKTLGRTHDASYNIFKIGKVASNGIKLYTETGRTDDLETESTLEVFTFTAPAILSGAGYNEAVFFVDVNHTFVSFITKITPSPDWFVGVDSLQLCVNGSWIDKIRIPLSPLDAGTDNGFTFTAPNWPTEPTGVIYQITSTYPPHQAGSFFYPQISELPPIAAVSFIKLKEYELVKTFHSPNEDVRFDSIISSVLLTNQSIQIVLNKESSGDTDEECQTDEKSSHSQSNEKDRMRSKLLAKIKLTINSPINFGSNANNTKNVSKNKSKILLKKKLPPLSKDCRVSNWSNWSPCSKLFRSYKAHKSTSVNPDSSAKFVCYGEMQRYRNVIRHAKYGGRQCPPLKEAKWCELERDCISEYF